MGRKQRGLAIFATAVTLATAAWAQSVEREGVIVSKTENTLNIRTREGPLTVNVPPGTRIREVRGAAGLQRRDRDAQSLIPGLIIEVEGTQSGNTITAESIDFKERDWRAAVATAAGTQEQFSELRQAIIEGQEYVIREESTVYFATGRADIAPQHREELRALAQRAPSFGNYRISVLGFTDPTGNPAANERLSLRRAGAVSNYMRQTGFIDPGRVLAPSAMGEAGAAPGMAAPTNNAEARRVVVRVVTPKTQLQN